MRICLTLRCPRGGGVPGPPACPRRCRRRRPSAACLSPPVAITYATDFPVSMDAHRWPVRWAVPLTREPPAEPSCSRVAAPLSRPRRVGCAPVWRPPPPRSALPPLCATQAASEPDALSHRARSDSDARSGQGFAGASAPEGGVLLGTAVAPATVSMLGKEPAYVPGVAALARPEWNPVGTGPEGHPSAEEGAPEITPRRSRGAVASGFAASRVFR